MCGNTAMSSCILPFSIKLLTILTKAMLGHQAEVLFEAGKCSCCPPCCVAQKSLRPHSKLDDGTELMGNCPTTYLYPLSSPPATPPPPPPPPLLVLFMLCHYFPGGSPHLFRAVLGRGLYGFQQQALLLKSLHHMCLESSSGGCQHFVVVFFFFVFSWFLVSPLLWIEGGCF